MRTLHALSVNVLNDRVIGLGLWVILLVPPMSFSPPALLHLKKRCGRFFTPSVDSQAKMEAPRLLGRLSLCTGYSPWGCSRVTPSVFSVLAMGPPWALGSSGEYTFGHWIVAFFIAAERSKSTPTLIPLKTPTVIWRLRSVHRSGRRGPKRDGGGWGEAASPLSSHDRAASLVDATRQAPLVFVCSFHISRGLLPNQHLVQRTGDTPGVARVLSRPPWCEWIG